jgi:hypothetical protein
MMLVAVVGLFGSTIAGDNGLVKNITQLGANASQTVSNLIP